MSRALRSFAIIAGSVALISTGIGAAVGAKGVFLGVTGATFTKVGAIAGLAGGVASAGAQMLQPKTPSKAALAPIVSIEHDTGKRTLDRGRGLYLERHGLLGTRDDPATPNSPLRAKDHDWRRMAVCADQFRHARRHGGDCKSIGQGEAVGLLAIA